MKTEAEMNIQADISNNLYKLRKFIDEAKIIENDILPKYKDTYVIYKKDEGFAYYDPASMGKTVPHLVFDFSKNVLHSSIFALEITELTEPRRNILKMVGADAVLFEKAWNSDFKNRCEQLLNTPNCFIAGNA